MSRAMSNRQRRRARQAREICSWAQLEQTLRHSSLHKLFNHHAGPSFVAAGRAVSTNLARKAIRRGLVSADSGDLFGNPNNSQTFTTWRRDYV
jgi:hypothetical protein